MATVYSFQRRYVGHGISNRFSESQQILLAFTEMSATFFQIKYSLVVTEARSFYSILQSLENWTVGLDS